ncbi:putative structural maintenance of chromosome complex subunit protein [Neofusicoccum parvum UCRNP2]|uniref:Structural maintenance of chromosomes protein 5 n=1 Tax=Botryosphaeria parva (strain UCR-NP2) TaxID=1287680 RepID=R1G9B9_BOTPV|nr:putative structural maintenance of chromosome complex subunit protein [Neofusicoccum parvum UCRNP2]
MARIRSSSELDDDESGEDSYLSQSRRNAKRPRTDDTSEASDDPVLPESYRAQPRNGASSRDDHAPLKHQPGSIVRVKLTNFVTYTSAEFQLGPSLNMIIGPNGTGKSTLVCAICLGLGWGPQHLGRAKELGEFVKHGAREAEIEIELCKGPRQNSNPVIRRVIRREGNKTSWSLNGQPTIHKEVTKLCRSFSIQIDNLCQFLPQDRVVEFAALNPVQLLEQTQRAAAADQMNEWHEQLKDMRKEQKTKADARNREQDILRDLQNRHNLQRADVERMQERQTLTEKLHAYERVRPFVHYRTAKERYDESRQTVADAKQELRDLQMRDQPTLEALEEKRVYYNQVDQVVKQRTKLAERMGRNAEGVRQRMNDMQTQIDDKEKQRDIEKKSNRERTNQRDRLQREVELIEKRMQERPPEFDPAAYNERVREKQRAARELQTENQDFIQKRQEIQQRIRAIEGQKQQAEREVENLKSQAGQQSNKLRQLSLDTWRAWDWIQKNRNLFTADVFGPPIVSCSVTDHRFANAIESMFQKGDFLSFTVLNRRDFSILSNKFQNMGLKDVHIKEAVRSLNTWRPLMSNDELRQYDLSGWLIDYISGPDPNTIEKEKSDLQKIRGEFEGLQTKKETCEMKRDQLQVELDEMAQRREAIDSETDELILRKGQLAIDYANAVKTLLDLHQDVYEAEIVLAEAKSELQILEELSQTIRREIAEHQENIRRLTAERDRLKHEAQRLVNEVNRIHAERSPEEEDLVANIQEGITLEDLEAEIASFQARLTLLHGGDPNAIRDFERRARNIDELEQKLRNSDAELEELQERINEIKSQWEPELDALVQKISDAFSFNFSKIGCAGQVSIYKAEDFAEWAIQIQVKFREQEQLSILDSHRQSGGERAVSTIFYLMALQSLARSPFRVVDEINQGMDPRNERMVHERMVDIACQEHTSQYFLITPKLLHGLKFHPRMTVHCIASGEYMPTDYRELDFKALVDVALRVRGKA